MTRPKPLTHEQIMLNRTDAEALFDALVHPPRITRELDAALKEHERRVSGSDLSSLTITAPGLFRSMED